MKRIEALRGLVDHSENIPLIVTCAATSRELAYVADRCNHFYLLDSMGLTTSVATGLALALATEPVPKVIAVDGDGSLLMNLGALATAGFLQPEKLLIVVLDNASYASTAGIPTYTEQLDLGPIAAACCLKVSAVDRPEALNSSIAQSLSEPGPHVVHVRIEPGNAPDTPLLLSDPVLLADRFQNWLTEISQRRGESTMSD